MKVKTRRVTLGRKYYDSISGFQGIAVACTVYLYGCVRALLAPMSLKPDGDFLPDYWFDEAQLEPITTKKVVKRRKGTDPGGPSRQAAPNRYSS